MNTDTRWPRLQLGTHQFLDWVEDYYSESRLLEMADAMRKNPHPIHVWTAAGEAGVWDTAIEKVLRALASSPRALDALNHRRPTPPGRVVGLNRAVHYHVQIQIEGADHVKKARGVVAESWAVTDKQVSDDVQTFSVSDPGNCRWANAEVIAEQVIALVCARPNRARGEVLLDFAHDMHHRSHFYRTKGTRRK